MRIRSKFGRSSEGPFEAGPLVVIPDAGGGAASIAT